MTAFCSLCQTALTVSLLILICSITISDQYAEKGRNYSPSKTAGIGVCDESRKSCYNLKKDTFDEAWKHKRDGKLSDFKCYDNLQRFRDPFCGGVLRDSYNICTNDVENQWENCHNKCRTLHPKLAGDCTKNYPEHERCVCFHADIGFCSREELQYKKTCERRNDALSGKHKGMMKDLRCRNDLKRFPGEMLCAAVVIARNGACEWKDCDIHCRIISPNLGGDCSKEKKPQCLCFSAKKIK